MGGTPQVTSTASTPATPVRPPTVQPSDTPAELKPLELHLFNFDEGTVWWDDFVISLG